MSARSAFHKATLIEMQNRTGGYLLEHRAAHHLSAEVSEATPSPRIDSPRRAAIAPRIAHGETAVAREEYERIGPPNPGPHGPPIRSVPALAGVPASIMALISLSEPVMSPSPLARSSFMCQPARWRCSRCARARCGPNCVSITNGMSVARARFTRSRIARVAVRDLSDERRKVFPGRPERRVPTSCGDASSPASSVAIPPNYCPRCCSAKSPMMQASPLLRDDADDAAGILRPRHHPLRQSLAHVLEAPRQGPTRQPQPGAQSFSLLTRRAAFRSWHGVSIAHFWLDLASIFAA
jgi:hypothetical protein